MVIPQRRPSAAMRSIHRELERRRPKPLAPKRPATKKPSASPPRPPLSSRAHFKVRPVRENPSSSITSMDFRSGSPSTHPPPPSRPRRQAPPSASFAANPLPPPSRCISSSAGSDSASTFAAAARHASPRRSAAASALSQPPPRSASSSVGSTTPSTCSHLKPGTRVSVRTRTKAMIYGKTLVLWLGATVVSATDGGYEVIYHGNLPRDDPFSTVHVPLHHVRQVNPTPPATNTQTKSSEMVPAPAAGKSLRLDRNLAPEMMPPPPPPPRPTTAGKSKRLVNKFVSEMMSQSADGNSRATDDVTMQNPPLPRPRAAASKSIHSRPSKMMKPTPRPTTAGKSLRLISDLLSPEMQQVPRPTTAGKSLCLIRDNAPQTKPAPRPTTAGKSIHVIRGLLSENGRQVLDADLAARQLYLQ